MPRRIGRLLSVVLIVSLAAGCGGRSRRLDDGRWYGKIVAVDVAHRRLTFAPACELGESKRWIAVPAGSRVATTNGNAAQGRGQSSDLTQVAEVAVRRHDPDFPPGWFVTVRDRAAASVQEDSGIRSSGKADGRTFACVWSRRTRAFVSS